MSTQARPRWFRFAWFLGKPPPLSERQWRVLGLVSAVSFFEQYDLYLFSLNLSQIQNSLGIAEGDLGWLGSTVRAGALLAFFVALVADRVGRRRVLLATVLAYTLLTAATALAPNTETFVALQFLARVFAVAETLLATVVIVEEFPDQHRGWGVGAFGAIQACGAGTAAMLYGFVDYLPFGWRALYALGVIPMLLIARWRVLMPETERFTALTLAPASARLQSTLHQLARLCTETGGRFVSIALVAFLFSFGLGGVGFFQVKYLLDVQQWGPPTVSMLTVVGGALAILANPLSGRWSDRFGRRRLVACFLLLTAIAGSAFYSVNGPIVGVLWIVYLFALFGADTVLTTYASESFPTSLRSTASGARSVIGTLGGIAGLASVSWLYPLLGSNWLALAYMPWLVAAAGLIALVTFRETAGQSLEQIAPEHAGDRG